MGLYIPCDINKYVQYIAFAQLALTLWDVFLVSIREYVTP